MTWAVWVTGLPGSGKSAIARAAAAAIRARGQDVAVVELDEMRRLVTPSPTYSDAERELVYRGLVYVAATLVTAGVPAIIDATGHRRAWRDFARAVLPAFAEVQLLCPLDVCRERERTRAPGHAPVGIYEKAGAAGARVPGVDVQYEPAAMPELTIDTTQETPSAAAVRIADLITKFPPAPRRPAASHWALWITGLPGSGKTTIAAHAAEALRGRGVAAQILDIADARDFVCRGEVTPLGEEVVHRVLIYAAKRLTDAGVAAIIDATAPMRRWRDLGRTLIDRFAEVQLVCPATICATRERAVRWRLIECVGDVSSRRGTTAAPDIVLAYEHAMNPELTIHTHVEDRWSAVESVLRLAARLQADERARLA
ncbi:MAG TPA: adenylyl-sulfate kinase [Methylomirabilota bacterium]|nr:adenylyl-sulfate kinase [Methylomirabilota bacterium]